MPEPPPPPRAPVNVRGTIIATVFVVVGVAALVFILSSSTPYDLLTTPHRTTVHVVERWIDVAEAGRRLPAWVRWVEDPDSEADVLQGAREAYDEMLSAELDAGLDGPVVLEGDVSRTVVETHRDRVGRPRAPPEHLYGRLLAFDATLLAVMAAGLAVLLAWLARGRPWPVLGDARLGAPWSVADGYGVSVRAVVLAVVTFVVLYTFAPMFDFWGTLLASLGMLWLIRRHLLRPRGLRFRDAFGLGAPRNVRGLVLATVAVVGIGLIGDLVILRLAKRLEMWPHWTEWADEGLLLGSAGKAALLSIDIVVWAPLFEEIGFRGLVYGTMRTRLRPAPAVLLSALLFAAVHLYSPAGFVSVAWSGVLWAILYEKTRSLWPCIACHALGNLLAVGGPLLLYR